MQEIRADALAFGGELPTLVPGLGRWLASDWSPSGATIVSAVTFRSPEMVRQAVECYAAARPGLQRAALRWGAAYAAATTVVPLAAATAGIALDVTPEALDLIVVDGLPVGARQPSGALLAVYQPRLPAAVPTGLLRLTGQRDLLWLVHGRLVRRHLAPVFALLHALFWVPRAALWRQLRDCCAATFEAASFQPALAVAAREDRQLLLATRANTILGSPNPLYGPS